MTSHDLEYILFPHTTLSERDCRHLSVFLPHLNVAEVARPADLPEWTAGQFSGCSMLKEDEEREQIVCLLKAYQEFATLHGETSILAALSHEWIAREARESRFCIQSDLRRKKPEELDPNFVLLQEASLFLEVARDLDEHEKELSERLTEIEGLEDQFLEILGITEEDELEDEISGLSPPLAPDRAALSFMLTRRMAFWLRLFVRQLPEKHPVLVSLVPDAPEELIDLVTAVREKLGNPIEPRWIPISPIPALDRLSAESFRSLSEELQASGLMAAYREDLDRILKNPDSPTLREALAASSKKMAVRIEELTGEKAGPARNVAGLSLAILDGCSPFELWSTLDKDARKTWPVDERAQQLARSLLIFLS